MSVNSYPSIYNLGHPATVELFDGPVTIEEKVDGSQFSFGVYGGEVRCRSKGVQLVVDAPDGMFARAVESVKERAHLLRDGVTYRGEYLQKPKHNTLSYSRIPAGHIVLFDVTIGEETYLSYSDKQAEAERIGLEVVPLIHEGVVESSEFLKELLTRESFLGGCRVEGFVVKNYAKFGPDKKVLLGKLVSEAFREAHKIAWKQTNPQGGDIIRTLQECFKSEARWRKAVQHLKEGGELENSPRDIAKLIKEVQGDIKKECADEIAKRLVEWALPQVIRYSTHGLPEWYKDQLLQEQFAEAA